MFAALTARVADTVTRRPTLVIVLMLLLTAGVAGGITQLSLEDQTNIDTSVFERTEVGQALDYVDTRYTDDETAVSSVYVRPDDSNALSRSRLLTALAYQQTVQDDPAVATELAGDPAVRGPPTAVGQYLAGRGADLAAQQTAIRAAGNAELADAIAATLSDPARAGQYLPQSYQPAPPRPRACGFCSASSRQR